VTGPQRTSPDNLHITVRCPSTSTTLSERMEQKFFMPPNRLAAATAILLRTCRIDPEYPLGQVNSVYFDTFDLDQHERSMEGELVKDKVRIRWYGEEHDPHDLASLYSADKPDDGASVDAWLELKSRRGFSSTKQRRRVKIPRAHLALPALGRGITRPRVLTETMAEFGFFPPGPIRPVIVISYFRRRFVEPLTGRRLSIDSQIRSTLLTPGGLGERALELPGGLVEVKCDEITLPPSLRELETIGSAWSRFSKYSACLEAHFADRGSVARLWPSGLMEAEPGVLSGPLKGRERERRMRGRTRGHEPSAGPANVSDTTPVTEERTT
jgi:hypothetical protein